MKQSPNKKNLKVSISARNLPSLSGRFYATASLKSSSDKVSKVVGKTETADGLSPQFQTKVETRFIFENIQVLKVEIYTSEAKLVGKVKVKLSSILQRGSIIQLSSKNKILIFGSNEKPSEVFLTTEKSSNYPQSLVVQMSLKFEKPPKVVKDVQLKLFRNDVTKWAFVCKTEKRKKNSLKWNALSISTDDITPKGLTQKILVAAFNKGKYIGDSIIVMDDMLQLMDHGAPLLTGKKIGSEKNRDNFPEVGRISFEELKLRDRFDFLDYLMDGHLFTPIFCVDFSTSNGPLDSPESLHNSTSNDYLRTIRDHYAILKQFNAEKSLLWGFSARIEDEESDCFSLSFDPKKPYCSSYSEIEAQYNACRDRITPSSNKDVTSIIEMGRRYSVNESGNKNYIIQLIMVTAGEMGDKTRLVGALKDAALLPISFVFVGMGEGDFSHFDFMLRSPEELEEKLDIKRKNFHFIYLKKIDHYFKQENDKVNLSQHGMSQIGGQFLRFCKLIRRRPTMSEKQSPVHVANDIQSPLKQVTTVPPPATMSPNQTFMLRHKTTPHSFSSYAASSAENEQRMKSHLVRMASLLERNEQDEYFDQLYLQSPEQDDYLNEDDIQVYQDEQEEGKTSLVQQQEEENAVEDFEGQQQEEGENAVEENEGQQQEEENAVEEEENAVEEEENAVGEDEGQQQKEEENAVEENSVEEEGKEENKSGETNNMEKEEEKTKGEQIDDDEIGRLYKDLEKLENSLETETKVRHLA